VKTIKGVKLSELNYVKLNEEAYNKYKTIITVKKLTEMKIFVAI